MTKSKLKKILWSGTIVVGAMSIATTVLLLLNNKQKANKRRVINLFNKLNDDENIKYFYGTKLNDANQLINQLNEKYDANLLTKVEKELNSLDETSQLIQKDSDIKGEALTPEQITKLELYWDKEYANAVESVKSENGYWFGLEEKHQNRINELILSEKNAKGKEKVNAREAFKKELINDSDLAKALVELKSKVNEYKSKIQDTIKPLKDESKVKKDLVVRLNTNNIKKLMDLLKDSENHKNTYDRILKTDYDLNVNIQDANVESWADKLQTANTIEKQYPYLIKNELNTNNFKILQISIIEKSQLDTNEVAYIEKDENLKIKKDNQFWLRFTYQVTFKEYAVDKEVQNKIYSLDYSVSNEQQTNFNDFKNNFKPYYDSLNIEEQYFTVNNKRYYKKHWMDQTLPLIQNQWVASKTKIANDWNEFKKEIIESDNYKEHSKDTLKSLAEYIDKTSNRFTLDQNEWKDDKNWTYKKYASNEKLVKDFTKSYDTWKNLLLNEKELKEKYEARKNDFKIDDIKDEEWKKTANDYVNSTNNKYEVNDKLFYYDRDQQIDNKSVLAYDLNVDQINNSNNFSKSIENQSFLKVLSEFVKSYDEWIMFYEKSADKKLIKKYFETESLFMWATNSREKIDRSEDVLNKFVKAIYTGTDFKNLEEKITIFLRKRKDIIDYIQKLDKTFEESKPQMSEFVLGDITKDISADEWENKKQIINSYISLYKLGEAKYNAEFKRLSDQDLDSSKIESLKNKNKYTFDFNSFLEISKQKENQSDKLDLLNAKYKTLYKNIQTFIDNKKIAREFKNSNYKEINYIHKHSDDWTLDYAKKYTTISDVEIDTNNENLVANGTNKYQVKDQNGLLWDIVNEEVISNNLTISYELIRKFDNDDQDLAFVENVKNNVAIESKFANFDSRLSLLKSNIELLENFINPNNYIYYGTDNEDEFFKDIFENYPIENLNKWKGNESSSSRYFNDSNLFGSIRNIKEKIIDRKDDSEYFYGIFNNKSDLDTFNNNFKSWVLKLQENQNNKWQKEFSERIFNILENTNKDQLISNVQDDYIEFDEAIVDKTVDSFITDKVKALDSIKEKYNHKYSDVNNAIKYDEYKSLLNFKMNSEFDYDRNVINVTLLNKKNEKIEMKISYRQALENSKQGQMVYKRLVRELNRLSFLMHRVFWHNRPINDQTNKNNQNNNYYDVNDAKLPIFGKYKFIYSNDFKYHPDFDQIPFSFIMPYQFIESPKQFYRDDKNQGFYDNGIREYLKFKENDWKKQIDFRKKLQERYNKAKNRLQNFNYDLIINNDLWDSNWETSPLPFGKIKEEWDYSHKGLKSYSLIPHSNGWESSIIPIFDGYGKPLTIENLVLHGDSPRYYLYILRTGLTLDGEIDKWDSTVYKFNQKYEDAIKKNNSI
ncbi:hypothetical protein DA803_00545 [[Mycoplasma] phocae]|uniref:Uncharacterized protein n=1 Tax=[Mycoplasma] phocae TaxID=142651 RepID=A0A2Z5IPN1_9BACT|nr:hypothetical protein [[Mycoplasma] phocae]AXE60585.1 hypothetical protein DA803_00545 [[Mycoplasma] phocae]